ncbi:EamA domain-containing membrane protein RarD [Faunimonas pinastri]|uniref:EamA domain-containing membrane protein RarD n=1 Tax=Faunimonas pinastri TaxID=1855383 RepID=A0A1H9KLD4_9HYPH|nr:DMT family transporter [Faunimonas pinastri]SEQ99960.1 EamA domain-containing membrane protein RarD [Faunimonas pinastri]
MSAAPLPDSRSISPGADRSAVLSGLLLMIVGTSLLPGIDALAKLASVSLSPGEITVFRFGSQTLFTLPLVVAAQGWGGLMPHRKGGNIARGALLSMNGLLYFAAVKYMPLADALAIFFVEPFILTLLSAVVQKERVGAMRLLAVVIGFAGALLVIRPSYGAFGAATLLPLAGALIFAVYMILNRRLAPHDSALTMQFTSGLAGTVTASLVLLAGQATDLPDLAISMPRAADLPLMVGMGLIATLGHLLIVRASASVPASLLAPFTYLEIVGATLLGYLVFGDFPDALKWVGMLLVVGPGIFVFWRESRAGRGSRSRDEAAR